MFGYNIIISPLLMCGEGGKRQKEGGRGGGETWREWKNEAKIYHTKDADEWMQINDVR